MNISGCPAKAPHACGSDGKGDTGESNEWAGDGTHHAKVDVGFQQLRLDEAPLLDVAPQDGHHALDASLQGEPQREKKGGHTRTQKMSAGTARESIRPLAAVNACAMARMRGTERPAS